MDYQQLLPIEFQNRMKALLGEDFDAFLASYQKPRHPSLRVNPLKMSAEEFLALSPWKLTRVPWCENGFYYSEEDRPGKSSMHEAGLYYIQEASAMSVAALSGTRPGERVLDLCAAPGGKSTQLAGILMGQGLLVANEIHPQRAKILSRNIERLGIKNAVVTNEAPADLARHFPSFFDRIVVDAPCSGEGMFRKEEAAIPNWSIDNVKLCAARQKEILSAAFEMLKVGGTLVYSTCTFAEEENENNIAWLLREYPIMKPVSLPERLGENLQKWGLSAALDGTSLRLFPHKLDGEGHFVAVLTKGEAASGAPVSPLTEAPASPQLDKKSRKAALKAQKKRGKASSADASIQDALSLWQDFASENLNSLPSGVPCLFGTELYLLPEAMSLSALKVLRPGLHLGSVKKGRFEPSHALLLALKQEDFKQSLSLLPDSPQARAFLRGESLPCEASLKGWTAVLIDQLPLGWGKASGSMLKNHYPKGLRIV